MENTFYKCPHCGSTEFITKPDQHNIGHIENGEFIIEHTESVDEEEKIFCRNCGEEIIL
ncbi:MAG: hypothetical protein PHV06_00985 [bacterium]|nr:hypothetical protein [bacterium]